MATTKKINRKELEQDEFIEKVFDLGEWLEAHWQRVAIAAGGVVVVVLAGIGFNAWRDGTLARANAALAKGLEAFEPARTAEGAAPPSRPQEALTAFEEAADLGGSRPIGQIGRYYRALALSSLGRSAEAVPELEKLASGSGPVSAQAKVSLANALAESDPERAASLLQEVAAQTGSAFPPDAALAMLGAMRARQGKTAEARKAYEDLLARFPQSPSAADARQRLGELGGTPVTLPASSSATIR